MQPIVEFHPGQIAETGKGARLTRVTVVPPIPRVQVVTIREQALV